MENTHNGIRFIYIQVHVHILYYKLCNISRLSIDT